MKNIFRMKDGMRIAYQEWGKGNKQQTILSLHGWLDNSNSFTYLGPYLATKGFHVVAIDFIGHGYSSHLPIGADYTFQKHISYTKQVIDILSDESDNNDNNNYDNKKNIENNNNNNNKNPKKITIVGHSLGGMVGSFCCSCYPELVDKLVMIESIGPIALISERNSPVAVLRKGIDSEHKTLDKISSGEGKEYKTLKDAIDRRIDNNNQFTRTAISREGAKLLVQRGAYLVNNGNHSDNPIDNNNNNNNNNNNESLESIGPIRFRHDFRLTVPSCYYYTNDQVLLFLDAIKSKSLLVIGESGGLTLMNANALEQRKQVLTNKGLLSIVTNPGSHHLHLDPETFQETASSIATFLLNEN